MSSGSFCGCSPLKHMSVGLKKGHSAHRSTKKCGNHDALAKTVDAWHELNKEMDGPTTSLPPSRKDLCVS
jgi:hypothetical protein